MLVCPIELEDEKTYQAAVSGISEKLKSEAKVTDSGRRGMDAGESVLWHIQDAERSGRRMEISEGAGNA